MVVQAGLVGAYVGVPITFSDGSVFGTFCCMSDDPNLELDERDVEFLGVLARVVADYLERELLVAQSDASKRDAFARVVHDLRSPLQAIVGYGSLLTQSFVPSHAQTIVAEATRLNDMLTELLDASASPPSVTFDLAEVVREQVPVFLAQSALHEIVVHVPSEPLLVLGVRERVVRVVSNLLSNAIKYSPEGGPIAIAADSVPGGGRVSVTDRGIGIPELQQPAIFTRFFRVETEATKEIGGTGLGLAFSFEAIRDQGGTMSFTSVEGEGSSFSFELPHGTL
jgi:signal transduction histidine kinase